MATVQNTLVWRAVMDARGFAVGNRQVQAGLATTGRQAGQTAGQFGLMSKAIGAFILAGTAREIGQFAIETGKMAENAERAGKAAEKVLGPALDGLNQRLEKIRRAAGFSQGEFNGLIAQMGLMTESVTETDEAQARFIERMLTAAAALAQFNPHGGDTAEALEAIFSGLKNNFNPLEQFGLKLKKADINERAEELQDMNSALSDSEAEFLAFIELIEERGGPALEEFDEDLKTIETSSGRLESAWKDLREEAGQELIPGIIRLIDVLLWMLDSLNRMGDKWAQLPARGAGFQRWIKNVSKLIVDAITQIRRMISWVDRFVSKIRNLRVPNPFAFLSNVRLPRFAAGGRVPGPKGQPRMIMAHGGETVSGLGGTQGGGQPVNITIQTGIGDPQEIARTVVEYLEVYQRSNGPIPIDVSGRR